jgi:intein-encoded DNA endonuclease-like protein
MRQYNKWTENQIQLLREFYPKHGLKFCVESLGIKEQRIKLKVCSLDLHLNKDQLQLSHSTRHKKSMDKYPVNAQQFIDVKTPESAYLLGLIWADGCLDGFGYSKRIRLNLKLKDAMDIKELFMSTGTWNFYKSKKKQYATRVKNAQGCFDTSNPFLFEYLKNNSYQTKHESASKILSNIPEKLHCFWWRGFFDGDGCIYYTKKGWYPQLSFSGPILQDWTFAITLFEKQGWNYNIRKRITDKGNSSQFICSKKPHVNLFGQFIYEGDWVGGLSRKYIKFQKVLTYVK